MPIPPLQGEGFVLCMGLFFDFSSRRSSGSNSVARRKSPTTRAVSAGCSMNGMCGAPGITAKRAPGIASAIFCTTGGGLDLSNSPTRHSAGTLISLSRGAVSIVAIAFQASAQPFTSVVSRRSRTAASPPASTNASLNQRRIVTSRMLPMPSRLASAPRCATIFALSGVCADGHDAMHDRAHVLRIFHRERLRHHPAEREAHDRARREVQFGQQRVHVVGIVRETRGRLVGRLPVPAQIGAQHGELLRAAPPRPRRGTSDRSRPRAATGRAGRCRRCDDVV